MRKRLCHWLALSVCLWGPWWSTRVQRNVTITTVQRIRNYSTCTSINAPHSVRARNSFSTGRFRRTFGSLSQLTSFHKTPQPAHVTFDFLNDKWCDCHIIHACTEASILICVMLLLYIFCCQTWKRDFLVRRLGGWRRAGKFRHFQMSRTALVITVGCVAFLLPLCRAKPV